MNARLRRITLALAVAAAVLTVSTPPSALADVPPFVGIAITFERGCPQGDGTLEVINETKGPVANAVNRMPVLWGREGKLGYVVNQNTGETWYPIVTGTGGSLERGDRVVVRLLSANGRLLFTSDVPYFPDAEVVRQPADYWLAVRLDCSRIPYRVAAQLPWPPYMPATSTAPASPESPPVPLILIATFGLALVGGWRYTSGCRRRST